MNTARKLQSRTVQDIWADLIVATRTAARELVMAGCPDHARAVAKAADVFTRCAKTHLRHLQKAAND